MGGIISVLYDSVIMPLSDIIQNRLPGPKCIPKRYVINLQKGGTAIFVAFLMWYYQAYTESMYTYLALHGTYGLCWLLKDQIFPDANWNNKTSLLSALGMWACVLGPYWVSPYLIATQSITTSPLQKCIAISVHTLGIATMMSADTQKHFILKERSNRDGRIGLISDGWFSRTRNPNFLGEMMIYSSYAMLANNHWLPWTILGSIWSTVFANNIILKERFLSRESDWSMYAARSGLLLPRLPYCSGTTVSFLLKKHE